MTIFPGQHKCFVPGCQEAVDDPRELCGPHWQLVPAPLRVTIVKLRTHPGHDEALASGVSQVLEQLHARRSR